MAPSIAARSVPAPGPVPAAALARRRCASVPSCIDERGRGQADVRLRGSARECYCVACSLTCVASASIFCRKSVRRNSAVAASASARRRAPRGGRATPACACVCAASAAVTATRDSRSADAAALYQTIYCVGSGRVRIEALCSVRRGQCICAPSHLRRSRPTAARACASAAWGAGDREESERSVRVWGRRAKGAGERARARESTRERILFREGEALTCRGGRRGGDSGDSSETARWPCCALSDSACCAKRVARASDVIA